MDTIFVGIDIAKADFAAVVRQKGVNGKAKVFANTPSGFRSLVKWLPRWQPEQLFICLEATGAYGEALAEYLHGLGMRVSVINPLAAKKYAQASLIRNQTDAVDAGVLADFCEKMCPRRWTPPSLLQKTLRALSRRIEDLQAMQQMERNRLDACAALPEIVRQDLQTNIQRLSEQIAQIKRLLRDTLDQDPELKRQKKLLMSIKGIGELTAIRFLAELGDLREFKSAKQLAAFLGLTPAWKRSGKSVQTKPRLSKRGSAEVRQILYMPAVVAMRWNPLIMAFRDRLVKARLCDMAIIGAIMHKLAHLMFGVVHSGLPFDPNYLDTLKLAS